MSFFQVKSFVVPTVNAAKSINNTGPSSILKKILPTRNYPFGHMQMERGGLARSLSSDRFFSTNPQQDKEKQPSSSVPMGTESSEHRNQKQARDGNMLVGRKYRPRSLFEPFRLNSVMDFDDIISRNSFFSDPFDDFFPRNPLVPNFTLKRQLENYMNNELQRSKIQMDFSESDNQYLLNADLPGIKKEDININVEDNLLSIEAERRMEKESKENKMYRQESYYGIYSRSITLPRDANPDSIDAKFEDGVLHLSIDKFPPDADNSKRKIEISG
jgi:HSP20 family protein